MKTSHLLILSLTLFANVSTKAQVATYPGTPPPWGPTGYQNARYYYLPDLELYYDITTAQFIFNNGKEWTQNAILPNRFQYYDLFNGYKVVMNNYHGTKPYNDFTRYRLKFGKGYRDHHQQTFAEKAENDKLELQNKTTENGKSNDTINTVLINKNR